MIINCKCSMCGGNESTVVGFDSYALALKCEYCGSDYSTTDNSLINCYRIKRNKERKEIEAREAEERKAREAREAEEKIRREEEKRLEKIRFDEEYASCVKDNNNKISKAITKNKIRKGLLIPRMIIYALALNLFGLISLAVMETAPVIITIVAITLFIISIVKVTKISHRITNLEGEYMNEVYFGSITLKPISNKEENTENKNSIKASAIIGLSIVLGVIAFNILLILLSM